MLDKNLAVAQMPGWGVPRPPGDHGVLGVPMGTALVAAVTPEKQT